MISRRTALKSISLGSAGLTLPTLAQPVTSKKKVSKFRYCLNTSTISGQKPGIKESIRIAAAAGYDGVEVWLRDLQVYLDQGHTLQALRKYISDTGIRVENAIGFATWIVDDAGQREAGFTQMEKEMNQLAAIGCKRVAAPGAGLQPTDTVDLFAAGMRYRQLLELGRKTGVMPQLEFWGASGSFFHLGQTLMVAAVANDADARLLPDIYHLFRGESGFEGLKLINPDMIEIFHLNDFVDSIPREEQGDKDRVYPGDGVAPITQVLHHLAQSKQPTVLSLELFNRSYWEQDMLDVAKKGLAKMKAQTQRLKKA